MSGPCLASLLVAGVMGSLNPTDPAVAPPCADPWLRVVGAICP